MTPVEQVARWLHETYLLKCKARNSLMWEALSNNGREKYRILAAELLANPPPALVEALKEKEAASGT